MIRESRFTAVSTPLQFFGLCPDTLSTGDCFPLYLQAFSRRQT